MLGYSCIATDLVPSNANACEGQVRERILNTTLKNPCAHVDFTSTVKAVTELKPERFLYLVFALVERQDLAMQLNISPFCHNLNEWRWNFTLDFVTLQRDGKEQWPTEVTSHTCWFKWSTLKI